MFGIYKVYNLIHVLTFHFGFTTKGGMWEDLGYELGTHHSIK
jgi:hypothetical protein